MTDSIWPIAPEVSGWIFFAFRMTIALGIFFSIGLTAWEKR